jgi:hypothetical protein
MESSPKVAGKWRTTHALGAQTADDAPHPRPRTLGARFLPCASKMDTPSLANPSLISIFNHQSLAIQPFGSARRFDVSHLWKKSTHTNISRATGTPCVRIILFFNNRHPSTIGDQKTTFNMNFFGRISADVGGKLRGCKTFFGQSEWRARIKLTQIFKFP